MVPSTRNRLSALPSTFLRSSSPRSSALNHIRHTTFCIREIGSGGEGMVPESERGISYGTAEAVRTDHIIPLEVTESETMQSTFGRSQHQGEMEKLVTAPISLKETISAGRALHIDEAVQKLLSISESNITQWKMYKSGIVRIEVALPSGETALNWLKHQTRLCQRHMSFYFRQRDESTCDLQQEGDGDASVFCGIGHSWLWKGREGEHPDQRLFEHIHRFLDPQNPSIKCIGATRFDAGRRIDDEWKEFGSYLFSIPAVEFIEAPEHNTLVCTLAWDATFSSPSSFCGMGMSTPIEAVKVVADILQDVAPVTSHTTLAPHVQWMAETQVPSLDEWKELVSTTCENLKSIKHRGDLFGGVDSETAVRECLESGQQGLDDLLAALNAQNTVEEEESSDADENLAKIVLARRTKLDVEGTLYPHSMLQHLQHCDPSAYQFCLSLPRGGTFVGSTPERLYRRNGDQVISEAIAGTRPRGPKGNLREDFLIGLELMRHPKDHVEFTLVRNWLTDTLRTICSDVDVDVHKSVIRRASVQHLYGRLRGRLKESRSDFDILSALHPTPAVCGHPQTAAKEILAKTELFDRGYYAGPFGWLSGQGAEFIVAIRSGLFKDTGKNKHTLSLFAGVGTVKESDMLSEWKELDLKVRPFKHQLSSRLSYLSSPNANIRMASLLVEELCRLGIHTFAVAPGSRSSPLVYAAAINPNCHVYPCIDERSLAFWSLGYARATQRPAPIITSSGTATANLMPSVIEASLSRVPMLLLTADRPSNLRNTGSNQTINQVKLFGDYTRYFHDIPPPSEANSPSISRAFLTTVDAAVRHACMDPPGPVHLNFQFDEPLEPIEKTVEQKLPTDRVLADWLSSDQCFTRFTRGACVLQDTERLLDQVQRAKRGLLIIGELLMPNERTAAAEIAERLQWPCIVDVLSGLKNPYRLAEWPYIHTADQILSMDPMPCEALAPDVILQFSGHLTSKRLMQFLQRCRETHPQTEWIQVSRDTWRDDPCHLVTLKVTVSLPQIYALLMHRKWEVNSDHAMYLSQWKSVDHTVTRSLVQSLTTLAHEDCMTEPYVSFILSQLLPAGHGLFLGNGMPIRDMDIFGGVTCKKGVATHKGAPFAKVAANRGASGIDGVISAAIGYAVGLRKPVTLLIGDISFFHDSNGLHFLRSEAWPPMTLVVINNGGGGIFDFLPIAHAVVPEMFNALWSTPQNINIATLCQAYGVAHNLVTKPTEFKEALNTAWKSHQHCVIEVVTDRKNNVELHQQIQAASAAAALRAVDLCKTMTRMKTAVIKDLSWQHFSLPLRKGPTTGNAAMFREGILLRITLKKNADSDNTDDTEGHECLGEWSGIGEIAPLDGLHSESLQDVMPQLRYLKRALIGQEVPREICLLDGHLSDWLSNTYGIEDSDMSPTVRFGFDTALLMAFSCMQGRPLHKLWSPSPEADHPEVVSNALLEDISNAETAIERCRDLLEQGYQTVKIKVGRGQSPEQEANVISSISKAFGDRLSIRLDANRAWDIDHALRFAEHLSCPNLEYIEEPVNRVNDIAVFCEKTQLPVALDESIASSRGPADVAELLKHCPGVVSCVLKPSCMGSIDRLVHIMKICVSLNRKTVISSAFETPVGISFLCELAAISNAVTQQRNGIQKHPARHGLGTVDWFQNVDGDCFRKPSIMLEASWQILLAQAKAFKPESDRVEEMALQKSVATEDGVYVFHYCQVKNSIDDPVVLFLHGFLGNSNDWLPIMHHLSSQCVCVAVDLPGHGNTQLQPGEAHADDDMYDFERVSAALCAFAKQFGRTPHAIVGYSLGGRLAQHMALHMDCPKLIVISGTSGIENPDTRAARLQQDMETAGILTSSLPYERFLKRWYEGSALWAQLRQRHPMYLHVLQRRQRGARPEELAKALVGMSTGKMEPLIRSLVASMTDVMYVFGAEDAKFCGLMECLDRRWNNRFVFLPFSSRGHGLLVESGLRLSTTISGFL